MSEFIKRLGILSSLFKPHHHQVDYQSKRLVQLKASLNPEHNMRVYYNNVVGYFNATTDKVKKTHGIR